MKELDHYRSIFNQMGFSPEDSATKMLRLALIKQIKQEIERKGWSQCEAAKQIGIAQPRIAEIVGLRIDKFSVELLAKYLHRLGKEVSLTVK